MRCNDCSRVRGYAFRRSHFGGAAADEDLGESIKCLAGRAMRGVVRQSDHSTARPNLFSSMDNSAGEPLLVAVMIEVNRSGIPTGLSTLRAAPVSERLRMEQSMTPPPNSIFPAFKTR